MTVQIELRCDYCRGNKISIPINGGEETVADCEDCGAKVGTLQDLKTQMSLQVLGRKKEEDRSQRSFSWGSHPSMAKKAGPPKLRVVGSVNRLGQRHSGAQR